MSEMDQILDKAWLSLLARALKKRETLRPGIGDEIDLYIPQARLLTLIGSNATIPSRLYSAAQTAARRNATNIVSKLGMPADYFWKFEYWPKARAFTTLEKLVSRIFSTIMIQAKEGTLKIPDLEVDPLRVKISFSDCVECAGISGLKIGICYYHAGIFSGIISALINRDVDAFETTCQASGGQTCEFLIGDKTDEQIKSGHAAYISPSEVGADLTSRLSTSLQNLPVRALGNLVDVAYLQMVVASTLLADLQPSATNNFEVGSQLGRKLAPVLSGFYGNGGLQSVIDFYSRLRLLSVEIKEDKPQLQFVIRECPETVGHTEIMEMTSFLSGELQGLSSEITKTELALKESRFEGDSLILTFTPKA